MKVKYIWAILIALSFFGCDDNTEGVGLGMLPDEDHIDVISKNYDVFTESVLSGPVYARTDTAYIGRYNDSQFGIYQAGFLTQLNCLDSIKFPDVYDSKTKKGLMVSDETLSTEIVFAYHKYFGDSIAPSHISIYELNKNIVDDPKIHYTDINASEYKGDFLAGGHYSAANLGVSDSIKASDFYEPQVRFNLEKGIGDKILKLNREHPEYFYDNDAFIENVFKGIYAECDEGSGSILYVDRVSLDIKFEIYKLDSVGNILQTHNDKDSIETVRLSFVGTKEVFQLNKLESSPEILEAKVQEKNHTYIKSPAGIFTQVTLPIDDIINDSEVQNDTIHSVKLIFDSYNNDDTSEFPMGKPNKLLMIPSSEKLSFFEENKINDNITSYIASLNNKGQYVFPNVSKLITSLSTNKEKALEEAKKEAGTNWNQQEWENKWKEENKDWNKMVLIPVTLDTTIEQDYYGNKIPVVINIRHDLKPEYVRLKGGDTNAGGDKLTLKAIFMSLNK
ncbi:hypothetical protein Bcop_1033 [Bacteroides coprosuis DSM 18011]|uniref:DUF4270 domain-containing protein n=1 Tax=Bacteroides coprosuis DSM 18011 TaxID=679937 RepID=F3ZTK9_9BACE|nr:MULTISPECIES: DUF4270 domain-containing protein [Bacteroides]EGJ71240.1 hypothetical protein Bcop_1033 [Bacteroides coprosuis DSM 18011]